MTWRPVLPWLTAWKKQVRSTRTREQRVLRRSGSYSLQYVFIEYLNLIVRIHMLHCQLKPLLLIVYAACPVGCGGRRVQCDQIAGGVPTLVVWLHHVQQHSWQLDRYDSPSVCTGDCGWRRGRTGLQLG